MSVQDQQRSMILVPIECACGLPVRDQYINLGPVLYRFGDTAAWSKIAPTPVSFNAIARDDPFRTS